jgi:hypothetical protein
MAAAMDLRIQQLTAEGTKRRDMTAKIQTAIIFTNT